MLGFRGLLGQQKFPTQSKGSEGKWWFLLRHHLSRTMSSLGGTGHPDVYSARMLSLQLCPTLCDSMDCSLPGSCPWDSPGKNTGVGCPALPQGIFLTQGSNPGLSLSPALAGRFFTTIATLQWEIKGVSGAPSPRSACFLASATDEKATDSKHGQTPARPVHSEQGAKAHKRPGTASTLAVLPGLPSWTSTSAAKCLPVYWFFIISWTWIFSFQLNSMTSDILITSSLIIRTLELKKKKTD